MSTPKNDWTANKHSPVSHKPLALVPHPTTRARSPIAPFHTLSTIPRLDCFWNGSRLVSNVSSESRCHGAVDDIAGHCGVDSGRKIPQWLLHGVLQGLLVEDVDGCLSLHDVGCADWWEGDGEQEGAEQGEHGFLGGLLLVYLVDVRMILMNVK
jgi:hypothetical protein